MAEKKNQDEGIAPACRECIRWKHFGNKCFYFWEHKKDCSMFTANVEEL